MWTAKKRRRYSKKYYQKNEKKLQAYGRARYQKFKEKIKRLNQKWNTTNRERRKRVGKRYYKKNLDKFKDRHYRYMYGITLSEVRRLRKAQKNRCAICNKGFSKTPYVDHCHKTGTVRGLLCQFCNTGLGMFQESCKSLKTAITYLKIKQ